MPNDRTKSSARQLAPEVEARQIAALGLARQGFAISHAYGVADGVCGCGRATCDSPGKHGGTGWLEHATREPDAIRARFASGDPNYGVVAPVGSRLLTVDEDVPGALDALGPLPHTLTVQTGPKDSDGHRGRHVYGRLPDGIAESAVPYLWAGGEVRIAGNGHAIGPYSRHRSGLIYTPLNGSTVAELPVTWMRNLIASGRHKKTEHDQAQTESDPGWYVEVGRHTWLVIRAKDMRVAGVDVADLFDQLTKLDRRRCRPPLTDTPGRGPDEIREIVAWVTGKMPEGEAGTVPPDPQDDQQAPPPSRIVSVDTYRTGVPKIIPWRCWPIAYSGGVTLFAGPPKVGKSTLTAQHQRSCETGDRLFGAWNVQIGPALLVTEEGGSAVVYKTNELHQLDILDRRAAAGLSFAGVLEAIAGWAATHPDGTVFIDTLAIWAGIADENDAAQTTKAIAAITALAQTTSLAIVLVHHHRKSGGDHGEAIRGSGAILATVDIAVEMSRVDATSDDRYLDVQGRVILPERFRLTFERSTMTYTMVDQAEAHLAEIERYLVGIPADGPGLTSTSLRDLWQVDPRWRVEHLLNVGRMRRTWEAAGGTRGWRYWSIPPVSR